MEITINKVNYVFREKLTVDEFIRIGLPPSELFSGFDITKISSEAFIKVISYQKTLMNTLCIQPEKKAGSSGIFGDMDIATFNKLASHPKFIKLMGLVMGGSAGEDSTHQAEENITT